MEWVYISLTCREWALVRDGRIKGRSCCLLIDDLHVFLSATYKFVFEGRSMHLPLPLAPTQTVSVILLLLRYLLYMLMPTFTMLYDGCTGVCLKWLACWCCKVVKLEFRGTSSDECVDKLRWVSDKSDGIWQFNNRTSLKRNLLFIWGILRFSWLELNAIQDMLATTRISRLVVVLRRTIHIWILRGETVHNQGEKKASLCRLIAWKFDCRGIFDTSNNGWHFKNEAFESMHHLIIQLNQQYHCHRLQQW